ncbi:MAG: aldehyde dehydrogenase family protein, partial [Chloroflexi bacterium]|nr:aldehyde dehydrogenase family protein [Chloroflexota bacterium]
MNLKASPREAVSLDSLPPFKNTPPTDFAVEKNREAFSKAISLVRAELGRDYPLILGGDEMRAASLFESRNPARPSEVIGRFQAASPVEAAIAVEQAARAFPDWSETPASERAGCLIEAARLMRERRHTFSAWMVLEVGKSWIEADADTAEAIDFLEFYAREMLRLDGPQAVEQIVGERSALEYIPLGVGAVIPPWNFPLAITTGMASAAFVAGNTVILKPSSDAPAIAYQFARVMEEAGLPPGVLNYLTGSGSQAGDALVTNPKVRFVAFTGSRSVGVDIYRKAAEVRGGQRWLKRVTAEMGGKNAVIVDEEADLDAAVQGVVASAFGFQGQKCSAGSRAIVSDKVADQFISKLKDAVERIKVGSPENPDTFVGPVVNQSQRDKILGYIEKGRQEGRLIAGGGPVDGADGYFVKPTVFVNVSPDAVIAQEEIFGPVLAVIRARDFDEALAIANSTEYGLTGAVYS